MIRILLKNSSVIITDNIDTDNNDDTIFIVGNRRIKIFDIKSISISPIKDK